VSAYGSAPEDVYGLLVDNTGLAYPDWREEKPYSLADFKDVFYSAERVNFFAHP